MKIIIRCLLLVFMLIQVTIEGWAKEVGTADELRSAITSGESYITLTSSIELGDNQTLTISSGNITLNLAGHTLSSTRTGSNGVATCINITGGENVIITGGGTITATSKGTYKGGIFNSKEYGYDAVGVSYNGGSVSVINAKIVVYPSTGKNGSGGGYTLDPNDGDGTKRTVSMMLPAGAYIVGGSESDYKSDGLKSSSTEVKPIKYNISYEANGAISQPSSVVYTIESKDFLLPTVSKAGYTFNGWLYNGNKVDASNLPTTSDRTGEVSMTFKADFLLHNYKINYKNLSEGNNPSGTPVSFTYESDDIMLPTPARNGYRFMGWYLHSDFSGDVQTTIPKGSLDDRTFYAKWYREYSISYNDNGGTMPTSYPTKYVSEEALELPIPTKNNNGFVAWFETSNFSGTPYLLIPKNTTGDKVFYAKWLPSLSITYNLNGGENPEDAPKNFTEESLDVTLPTPTRKGYNFSGWYREPSFLGSIITKISNGTKENQTFYARWSPISYKITYNLNGGSNPGGIKLDYTIEDNDISLLSPTRDGGVFAGWYTDVSFSHSITTIKKGSIGDISLYAKWTLTSYTIKLNTTGGSSLSDITYNIDTDNYILSTKSRREGYTFAGWYKDEACTQSFGEVITKGTSGNFTLFAKWIPLKYTITYNTYSDVKVPSSTYTIEEDVTLPVPQRTAYSFAGWYESDRLEGEPIMAIEKGSTGNRTLYAKWSSGSVVNIVKAANGTFTVKNGDTEVKSGDYVGQGTKLTLTATPTAPYTLSKWVVNGKDVTGNPVTVEMPASGGLAISAVFADNRVAASAPEIVTNPVNTDKIAKGETVKVQLQKTDESTSLYYSVDGAPDKAYTGEFMVSSSKDTLVFKAIARKTDYKDGVTTRLFIFDNSRITLTFDLPLGVKATNPTGGDVVTATTTGGSFEFKLTVDKDYYTNLDSMVVSANDSTITGNTSGLYTLTNCSSDITVTVSGLKAKTCTVTLQQTENGQIKFTDGADETTSEVGYGSSVSITAVADENFKFLQWNTGSQSNPLNLTVSRDTTISARFISDYKSYMMTLPQMEGVTVKPFSGYSTEVKKDGTFKFYLVLAKGYREGNLVVRANGEELTKNKGGYAIYHINKNISISVNGIVRDSIKLTLPDHVTAKVVETMSDVAGQGLFEETMLLLQAKAPEGKIFSKWTDGKTDNPRMATTVDAAQLIPLFTDKEDAAYAKVILNQSPGAGITGANSNMDAVKSGDVVQLKVVLLPAYSQSEVVLTADDKVLTPETSLRAASETKTYVYNLPVDKDGITVKVSGLKLNSYEVTVSQTNGGTVSAVPAGKVTHGDKVQLKAEAASGMLFVKWWDGNTLNPYPYTVASDTEVKACFVGTESTVDNESIRKDDKVSVSVTGRVLSVAVAEESALYIWDYKGSLFRNQTIPAGEYTMSLPSGVYLVKVGDKGVKKIIIR